jgi:hypothetical protein
MSPPYSQYGGWSDGWMAVVAFGGLAAAATKLMERLSRSPIGWWPVGYAIIFSGYLVARFQVLGTVVGEYPGGLSLTRLVASIPELLMFYLRLSVWPVGLGPTYPVRAASGLSDPGAWIAWTALVAIGGALAWGARRRPEVGFAACWWLACILPALNIRAFRPEYVVHQRYLDLAILGPCLLQEVVDSGAAGPDAYRNLAVLTARAGRHRDAMAVVREGLRHHPGSEALRAMAESHPVDSTDPAPVP